MLWGNRAQGRHSKFSWWPPMPARHNSGSKQHVVIRDPSGFTIVPFLGSEVTKEEGSGHFFTLFSYLVDICQNQNVSYTQAYLRSWHLCVTLRSSFSKSQFFMFKLKNMIIGFVAKTEMRVSVSDGALCRVFLLLIWTVWILCINSY